MAPRRRTSRWPLSLLHESLWALMLGIVLLDLGGQALHVTNQSLILRSRPEASSRAPQDVRWPSKATGTPSRV